MKRTTLLNAPLSAVISELGHTDTITLCDCGLPIPETTERIDLAITQGTPTFYDALAGITAELMIEKVTIAEEMQNISPEFHKGFLAHIEKVAKDQGKEIEIEEIPHDEFKKQTTSSKAIVRSGECTYYANVIITAGVAF